MNRYAEPSKRPVEPLVGEAYARIKSSGTGI